MKFKKFSVFLTSMMLSLIMLTSVAFAATLLPVGGNEFEYDPEGYESGTCYMNCYAYATLRACALTPNKKIQPGEVSGQTFSSLTEDSIISAVKRDLGSSIFYKTTANEVPKNGFRKVALVIAPGQDYHWYAQNSDGYWSHKQGLSPITNLDASGNRISNPQTCNRNYFSVYKNTKGNAFTVNINYSQFCGFYMVKNK